MSEQDNTLKKGMYFSKDGEIYVLADSVNQRWLVNINSGVAIFWGKKDSGYTSMLEGQGYKKIELPQDVFMVMAKMNV